MRQKPLWLCLAASLCLLLLVLCLAGCTENKPSPQAQQTIQQNQDNAAIAAAKVKANAQVAAAKAAAAAAAAAADPVKHPFVASTNAVKKAQAPLGLIATIAFVVAAVGLGLKFYDPLAWLGRILFPIGTSVAVFAFCGVVALPFFPWVTLGVVALFILLVVYEIIRAKGNLKTARTDLEDDIGFFSLSSTAPSLPASSMSSSTIPKVQLVHG